MCMASHHRGGRGALIFIIAKKSRRVNKLTVSRGGAVTRQQCWGPIPQRGLTVYKDSGSSPILIQLPILTVYKDSGLNPILIRLPICLPLISVCPLLSYLNKAYESDAPMCAKKREATHFSAYVYFTFDLSRRTTFKHFKE